MPQKTPSERAAGFVSDFVQAWVDEVQTFYDGVRSNDGYDAQTVMHETSAAIDRMLPIAKRGIDLTLDLMRPWSTAFTERSDDAS